MGNSLKKQKKMFKYGIFPLALGLLLIFTLIPISSTFASTDEDNSNIISDKIINLSDDEYQSLLESFETKTISPTNPGGGDTIDGASKPAQERTDCK